MRRRSVCVFCALLTETEHEKRHSSRSLSPSPSPSPISHFSSFFTYACICEVLLFFLCFSFFSSIFWPLQVATQKAWCSTSSLGLISLFYGHKQFFEREQMRHVQRAHSRCNKRHTHTTIGMDRILNTGNTVCDYINGGHQKRTAERERERVTDAWMLLVVTQYAISRYWTEYELIKNQ